MVVKRNRRKGGWEMLQTNVAQYPAFLSKTFLFDYVIVVLWSKNTFYQTISGLKID